MVDKAKRLGLSPGWYLVTACTRLYMQSQSIAIHREREGVSETNRQPDWQTGKRETERVTEGGARQSEAWSLISVYCTE